MLSGYSYATMNIVFYSTSSTQSASGEVALSTYPKRTAVWKALSERYKEHQFYVALQSPFGFLCDDMELYAASDAASVSEKRLGENLHILFLPVQFSAEEVASYLLTLQPALAIAATAWLPPYDWLSLQDAMVAESLRASAVHVLCHSAELSLNCFDKSRTHALLESIGIAMPKAVYVHHELYWCERRHHDLVRNVYKDYVLSLLRSLHYPVVIKDTVGLSSYSMEVAVSYKQALAYLNSGRTKVDRIVEEYIAGDQFGSEVYGADGAYTLLPPLMFSLNRYGITSPKQSVKLGGALQKEAEDRFHFAELSELLLKLAQRLQFSGCAQIDLVHTDEMNAQHTHWYVIEINTRLSGMSETYAAALDMPLAELMLQTALKKLPAAPSDSGFYALNACVCNVKLQLQPEEQLALLAAEPSVAYVHQIYNPSAKQEREKGYCELILRSESISSLMAALDELASRYSTCMEDAFVQKAHELASRLQS